MYTLGDIPRKNSLHFPNKEAIVFEETRLTYKQLNDRVNRLANALSKIGFKKGDQVTVLAENTHKYLEIYFASAKLGMSTTPLNFRLSDDEIIHIVNDSEATCFFAGDGYEERTFKMQDRLHTIDAWIAIDNKLPEFIFYEEILEDASETDYAGYGAQIRSAVMGLRDFQIHEDMLPRTDIPMISIWHITPPVPGADLV
jgi:acyl-coenzyme A synthetase/AMP-(fatty) acid ligase